MKEDELERYVARMGEKAAYKILIWKPEGIRQLGRPRSRGKCNIKTDLMERWLECVDWIHLAQDTYRWKLLRTQQQIIWFYKIRNFFAS